MKFLKLLLMLPFSLFANPELIAISIPDLDLCKIKCFDFRTKTYLELTYCGIDHTPDNPIYNEDYLIIGGEECSETYDIIYLGE